MSVRRSLERELSAVKRPRLEEKVEEIDVDGDGRADLALVPYNRAGAYALRKNKSYFPSQVKSSSNMSKRQYAPVAATTSYRQGPGRNGLTIRGRDFLGDVVTAAGGAFTVNYNKVINPADTGVFRWFGRLAGLFETYKFTGLSLVYEPQCPSSTAGAFLMYFDPDPTNTANPADWAAACQIGVNVHGAAWAKHTLNIPLSLCASRREYYIRETFPAINVAGDFAYDPYEFFAGKVGAVTSGSDAAATETIGKIYIDYSCMLGKANDSSDTTVAASGQVVAPPLSQMSKSILFQRVDTTTSNPASYTLIGPNATDTLANGKLVYYGFAMFQPAAINSSEWIAATSDLQLKVIVTVSSNAGTWTANCVNIGLSDANGTYTYGAGNAGAVTVATGKFERLYDAGVGTTAYMGLWDVFVRRGQKFAVKMAASVGSTQWWNQAPGYTIRILSATYGV